jgi:acyl-CoA thioester hydrolase
MSGATGFVHRHRVRYHETDAQQHVFNSRYLEFVDVAMTEFFRWLGWPYPELNAAGCDPSLVHVEIDFHRAATFDTELEIAVRATAIGNSSFTLTFALAERGGERVATAVVVYVNYDVATRRSRPLPGSIRDALRAAG